MSNLGSIHCGAIYHNLSNFGTNSILITMGEIHKEEVVLENGEKQIRDICEFGANIDERIADGLYFAKSIQLVQYILDNPELLEDPANTKINIER
jgi:pyruvate/2-oxoglutarate dehydrogenase complex dihydrolipoamide acyltransferase (E2) component